LDTHDSVFRWFRVNAEIAFSGDQRGVRKTTSDPGKTENEGIPRPRRKQISGLASSFSLTEKRFALIPACSQAQEFANLTSAAKPVS